MLNKIIKNMGTTKKYELTDNTINIDGITLHRIKALKDFSDVKAGDFGGWIEKEDNLSQIDDAMQRYMVMHKYMAAQRFLAMRKFMEMHLSVLMLGYITMQESMAMHISVIM